MDCPLFAQRGLSNLRSFVVLLLEMRESFANWRQGMQMLLEGVLINYFDKSLITVRTLTKNNGSVKLPLIDLTNIEITYCR